MCDEQSVDWAVLYASRFYERRQRQRDLIEQTRLEMKERKLELSLSEFRLRWRECQKKPFLPSTDVKLLNCDEVNIFSSSMTFDVLLSEIVQTPFHRVIGHQTSKLDAYVMRGTTYFIFVPQSSIAFTRGRPRFSSLHVCGKDAADALIIEVEDMIYYQWALDIIGAIPYKIRNLGDSESKWVKLMDDGVNGKHDAFALLRTMYRRTEIGYWNINYKFDVHLDDAPKFDQIDRWNIVMTPCKRHWRNAKHNWKRTRAAATPITPFIEEGTPSRKKQRLSE